MLENARSSLIKFLDYLQKNSSSFYLMFMGLSILFAAVMREPDFGLLHVLGIVTSVVGIVFAIDNILHKKFNIEFSMEQINFIIGIVLFIILFPQLFILNHNFYSYILIFILVIASVRVVLFSSFMFAWKKSTKISQENKKVNAMAFSYAIILLFLLNFASYNFLSYKVFILFLVYGIYHLVREKYLMPYVKLPFEGNITYRKSIFSGVWNLSGFAAIVILFMFLLLYHNVITIYETQPTLYYFYSTTAQVFASILGIVVMFSIFILQTNKTKHDDRIRFLKRGLKGFTILYMLIIVISITGIVMKDTIDLNSIPKIPDALDSTILRDILSISIFELIFLMSPAALLYLFAMISDFLILDITINAPSGTSIPFNTETVKKISGADRTKIVIGNEE